MLLNTTNEQIAHFTKTELNCHDPIINILTQNKLDMLNTNVSFND